MIPHLKLLGTSPLKAAKSTTEQAINNNNTSATPDDSVTATPAHVHSHNTLPASRDGDRNVDAYDHGSYGHNEQEDGTGKDDGFVEEREVDGENNEPEGDREAIVEQEREKYGIIKDTQALDGVPLPFENENQTAESKIEAESAGVSEHVEQREGEGVMDGDSNEQQQKNPLHSEGGDTSTPPPLHSTTSLPLQADQSVPITSTTFPPLHSAIPHPTQTDQSDPTTATPPPLHSAVNPPSQIDHSAPTTPNFDTTEKQRVGHEGNLQSVRWANEKSKELAPFPQLETLSLVNNMVRFNCIALWATTYFYVHNVSDATPLVNWVDKGGYATIDKKVL